MLTSIPPTGIPDSELSIEPFTVSLSISLSNTRRHICGIANGGGTPPRKRTSFKLLRWNSCHDFSPNRKPWNLRRHMTDHSLTDKSSPRLVEVYDGNLGISVVPLSSTNYNTRTSSLNGDSGSGNESGKMGNIYLKCPASSPPSLRQYIQNYMPPNIHRKIDQHKTWVRCNDDRRAYLSSESRISKTVKPTLTSARNFVSDAKKGNATIPQHRITVKESFK